jgi:hypothetical protein
MPRDIDQIIELLQREMPAPVRDSVSQAIPHGMAQSGLFGMGDAAISVLRDDARPTK